MSSGDVRKGVSQAKENEEAFKYILGEIVLFSVVIGYYFKSWYVGGGVFFGLLIAFFLPYVSWLLIRLLSVFWSVVFAALGTGIQNILSDEDVTKGIHVAPDDWNATVLSIAQNVFDYAISVYSTGAGLIFGILAFLGSLEAHKLFKEYSNDINDDKDRNF